MADRHQVQTFWCSLCVTWWLRKKKLNLNYTDWDDNNEPPLYLSLFCITWSVQIHHCFFCRINFFFSREFNLKFTSDYYKNLYFLAQNKRLFLKKMDNVNELNVKNSKKKQWNRRFPHSTWILCTRVIQLVSHVLSTDKQTYHKRTKSRKKNFMLQASNTNTDI